MNNIIGTTDSETAMIKAIQRAVGAAEDGVIGGETMAAIAAKLGADCFPITLEIYDQPTIIAKDVVVCNPSTGLRAYNNSLSGSFSYQKKPCSILVNWGKAVCESACHAWLGQPETVLYRLYSGEFGIQRCMYASQLPDGVKWAVGGMGLLDFYDPDTEGFTGTYADVLRKTNHTAMGIKGGMVYLIYCSNMTGREVDEHCRKLGLELAVMLDGGHVAAVNGAERFARINTSQVQYYMIQGV